MVLHSKKKRKPVMSRFIGALSRGGVEGVTANGALSHATSGSKILDYFAKAGTYSNRSQEDVDADMEAIFSEDADLAFRVVFYNRIVTRKCNGFVEETSLQKGQGRRDEFIRCVNWLARSQFAGKLYSNLWLIPEIGCWKDLFYFSPVTNLKVELDQDAVFSLLIAGMNNEKYRGLIAKYLPAIKSKSKVKNERHGVLNYFAKGLCARLGWKERDYRKFKSSPENCAHLWQRQMCSKEWNNINFGQIPGKALAKFSQLIDKYGLTQNYLKWLSKQPVAKFTGYPFELYQAVNQNPGNIVVTRTADAQFEGLIAKVKADTPSDLLKKGVLCALDTSGSMGMLVQGKTRAIDVCVGLGIYFASLIEGHFHNNVVMFDDRSKFLQLKGTFTQKVSQIPANAMGIANFQSVINEIVRVRKSNPSIPVEEFPKVLLVVSDMQFNPSGSYYSSNSDMTKHEKAVQKLKAVGLDMSFIWWNVNGSYGKDSTSTINDNGTTLISGFDPSVINMILDGEKKDVNGEVVVNEVTGEVEKLNPYEQMLKVLDQEILNVIV